MGLSVLNPPAAAGGGIKSVQRGSAGGAGNVTITAVDIAKSFVNIFGTTSSGTVSASFNMSMNAGSMSYIGANASRGTNSHYVPTGGTAIGSSFVANNASGGGFSANATVNAGNASVGAGSNNLVAAVVQGFLANSTTLTVSGACRYEVVEFN